MDKSSALTKLIAAIPIRDESMKQLLSLYDSQHDPLAGTSVEDKLKVLKTTSYRDYSTKICRCSEEVAKMFWAAPLMLLVGIISGWRHARVPQQLFRSSHAPRFGDGVR